MDTQELRNQLVRTIEHVATLSKFLSETSSSLLAVRYALEDVSPLRFEAAYEKHFVERDCEQIRQGLNLVTQSLLDSARDLKQASEQASGS
jgi:hypothetical protein